MVLDLAIGPRGRGDLAPGQLAPRPTPRRQPPAADPPPGSHLLKDLYLNDIRTFLAQQKRLHHVLHGRLLVHVPLSTALLLFSITHAVVALRY